MGGPGGAAAGGVWTRLRELFVPKSADRAVYASRWARGGARPLWFEGWRRAGPLNRSSLAVRHGRVSPCSVPLQSATPCFGFSVLSDSVEAGGWYLRSNGAFLLCFCFVSSAKVYVAYGHYFWWHIPVAVLYTNPIGFSLYCIYIYIGVYL